MIENMYWLYFLALCTQNLPHTVPYLRARTREHRKPRGALLVLLLIIQPFKRNIRFVALAILADHIRIKLVLILAMLVYQIYVF